MDVPPILTNGKATPVTGNKLVATAMFAKACITRLKLYAAASKAPKAFGLRVTIFTQRYRKTKYSDNTARPPIIPYSSIIIAYTKSA
ncbi:hypothetical protein D3C78_1441900 [compost metagenome]